MPTPYTDEQQIIDDIGGGRTLDDLYMLLNLMHNELAALRERAERGKLPPAALLVQEFMARADLDGGRGAGGSVYGIDFMIDPCDPQLPPMLEPIHQHPRWTAPQTVMSWQDYLDTWT